MSVKLTLMAFFFKSDGLGPTFISLFHGKGIFGYRNSQVAAMKPRDGHGSGRPAGRVGSGRSGRGSESRQIWRVGSGRVEISEMHYFFLFVSRLK